MAVSKIQRETPAQKKISAPAAQDVCGPNTSAPKQRPQGPKLCGR